MSKFLDAKLVKKFLKDTPDSQFFTVTFEKLDGSTTSMTGRRDVRKYLKDGVSTIKANKNLQSLYSTDRKGYRCFDVTRVYCLNGNGYELKVASFSKPVCV